MPARTLRGYSVIITLRSDNIFIIKIMASPIWKDNYVTMGTAEYADFRMSHDTQTVYQGRAYKKPGEDSVRVRINDICADYLSSPFPALTNGSFTPDGTGAFAFSYLPKGSSLWLNIVPAVTFMDDWSYDYGFDYSRTNFGRSNPITHRIDPRQWLMVSIFGARSMRFTVFNSTGIRTVSTDTAEKGYGGTGVIDVSLQPNPTKIVANQKTYTVVEPCNRYALYYLNSYGGWDSLLIEGAVSESDSVERHTASMEYDNSDRAARGERDYLNSLTKEYIFRTGWLSDDESSRMHELLNSTDVYGFDLVERAMFPLVLTGTETEYKTYKGNGNKLVNYSISSRLAQGRERR